MERKIDASERMHVHLSHTIGLAQRVRGQHDRRTFHMGLRCEKRADTRGGLGRGFLREMTRRGGGCRKPFVRSPHRTPFFPAAASQPTGRHSREWRETCIGCWVNTAMNESARGWHSPQQRKPTTMSKHECISLPVSLVGAPGADDGARSATLTVNCPLTNERVLLQRCAFCGHSEGLTLDPLDGSLNLNCHAPVGPETPEPSGR